MFAEAIPGVIIQLSAILSDRSASNAAIISLATSALTTGFISTSLSFDWDTDPKKRAESAEFYGYMPNRARKRAGEIIMWKDFVKQRGRQNASAIPKKITHRHLFAHGDKIAVIFASMILISAIMLLVRASVIALLGHVAKRVAIAYLLAEMGIYLVFKIGRGDFYYWLPLEGWMEVFFSLLARIVVKIVTDFTSNGECPRM